MANNVAITAGTGTSVATDDVGGIHYQVVKLAVGTEDSPARLGHLEDAAHASGDAGFMALGVRNDAGTALAGTTGDYIPLSMDSAGALRVTGAGGGTQYNEADTDASITGTAMLWEDTSDTLRAVSAAKPLPVTVTTGLVVIDDTDPVDVRGNTTLIRPTITVSATPDYSAGDVMGGEITVTNAVRTTSGGAVLQSVALWCDDALTPVLDLMFFDADLSGGAYTDNAALALSAADKLTYLGHVHLTASDWTTIAGDTWATKIVGLPLKANGTQDLRMIVVAGETINLSGTAVLTVALGLLRD